MGKLTLKAAPTFTVPVDINVPGQADPVPVRMTFKHRTKSELLAFEQEKRTLSDLQVFMRVVLGWELEDEVPDTDPPQCVPVAFNEATAAVFLDHYAGAALSTWLTYVDELFKARRKN